MKHIITAVLILSILCANMLACRKIDAEIHATEDSATENIGTTAKTEPIGHTTSASLADEWNTIGGGEDPYKELYVTAVSGFLVADGTFTRVSTYYNEEEQARWYHALETYDEKTEDVPLLVYLIREMGITRAEYIHYLDTIGAAYTDGVIDVLFSDDNKLINEAFHSPLTLCEGGRIYTVYDLADLQNETQGADSVLDRFPEDKIEKLYQNMRLLDAQYHISPPEIAAEVYHEMAVVVSGASISEKKNPAK